MKRITYFLLVFVFLMGISSTAFAAPGDTYYTGEYEFDAPRRFEAVGFICEDIDPPQNRLQNLMQFDFINGKEIYREFTATYGDNEASGPAEYTVSMTLTYNKDLMVAFDSFFIDGTFTYRSEVDGEITEYTGIARAHLILILPANMGFISNDFETAAIVLEFYPSNADQSNWFLYLDTPNDELVCMTETNVDLIMYSGDMGHESRPHIPSPWKQSDVAAGVGISTIGIAVLNALTKTSIFGNASFNGSFDPTSAGPGGQAPSGGTGGTGPAAASGTGASASSAIPTQPSSASMAGSGSGGGIIGAIKDFFKSLFANLRDMLTDEGRSYAGGKLSESLEDIVPDNVDQE